MSLGWIVTDCALGTHLAPCGRRGIRTPDARVKSPSLWPTELHVHYQIRGNDQLTRRSSDTGCAVGTPDLEIQEGIEPSRPGFAGPCLNHSATGSRPPPRSRAVRADRKPGPFGGGVGDTLPPARSRCQPPSVSRCLRWSRGDSNPRPWGLPLRAFSPGRRLCRPRARLPSKVEGGLFFLGRIRRVASGDADG